MVEEKYIKLRNENIYTKTFGKGEPLIFLHGGPGGEHRYFLPHLNELSSCFTLIFYDQLGCGQSEKLTNEDYSMDEEVETLEALREYLGLEKMNLVGESWGSMLSLLYAAKYPNNVNKIFMLAAVGATMEGFLRFEKELLKRLTKAEREWLEELSPKVEKGEVNVKEIFKIIDPYYLYSIENLTKKTKTNTNGRVNEIISKDIIENYDVSKEGKKLRNIPILVAQGANDIITPEILEQVLIQYIPHIELRVIEECGHWSVIEKPMELQALMKDFFK